MPPLYRYTEDCRRVSNITQWSIRLVNDHYRKEWGSDFEKVVGKDGITAEQIFAYTYAVLHDPVYRNDYEVDLRREFPRLPLYHDFDVWARMGQELLDLHVGFESAEPYPLKRVETGKEPGKPKLRADTEGGVIVLETTFDAPHRRAAGRVVVITGSAAAPPSSGCSIMYKERKHDETLR